MPHSRHNGLGHCLLDLSAFFTCAVIAGSMFLFTSQLKDAFPPLSLVSWRLVLGSCALLACQLHVQACAMPGELCMLHREEVKKLACVGICNTVLPYTLFAAALSMGINVSAASALVGSTPIFAVAITAVGDMYRQRGLRRCWQRGDVPGLIVGMLGVLMIVSRHGAWSGGSFLGVVLQLSGVISKASAATLAQYYNWRPEVKASVMLQALVQAAFGALVATTLSLALDFRGVTPSFLDPRHLSEGGRWEFLVDVGAEQWLCLGGLAIFGSCVVYMLQFLLLRRVGAVRQTLMDQFALIIGVLEGAILLGEWQEASSSEIMMFISGAIFVMLGSVLLYRPRFRGLEDDVTLEPMVEANRLVLERPGG